MEESKNSYQVVIVGGGVAGLTAAAFLTKYGRSVLLLEKEPYPGGLINSFTRDGFTFDGGIRALEDSGVLFPMLRKLGLEIPLVNSPISLGIEDQVIHVESEANLADYEAMLVSIFPDQQAEIHQITKEIGRTMKYMEVQYGIENPLFLDVKEDREYFIKKIFPWMFRYLVTFPKIHRYDLPVEEFLRKYTQHQPLIDIIAQHFFQETPAFFALSYLKLYLDYNYPLGGTGTFIRSLVDLIQQQGGQIKTNSLVTGLDISQRQVSLQDGSVYPYQELIWAADQKTLYEFIGEESLPQEKTHRAVHQRRRMLADKKGNDSILTLYLAVDLPPEFFAERSQGHLFYTPSRVGEASAGPRPDGRQREESSAWLSRFFEATTYEVAMPVLRDPDLAPPGKTGLIISVLFDYTFTQETLEAGWHDEFKSFCEAEIIRVLEKSIYPGLSDHILQQFSATPLTMERYTGNHQGAITGWAFTNQPLPAESRLPKIASSVKTPIPHVHQAGQWTYSPSGLPVSIITGKLAADRAGKALA